MDSEDLKKRIKQYGLRIIRLVESLPSSKTASVIGNQLLRAGTSVGANYRAACRARSKAEFIAKAGISIEEADESLYWMEPLIEANIILVDRLDRLMHEADELTAILTASVITARQNRKE